MTLEQLRRIESELGVKLPGEYREIMLNYPFDTESMGDYLFDEADRVIEENRECREVELFGLDWRTHHFIFGSDGLGNPFFIDLSKVPAPIMLADHEDGAQRVEEQSFSVWVDKASLLLAEDAAKVMAKEQKNEKRKWWQLWK